MSLATVLSRAQNALAADLVTVEVHLANGLPALNIVGLPEAAVRESKDRVRAALQTCGYQFPNRRMTCNLAPADLPKEGGRFDLAIALGILCASEQLPAAALDGIEVLGELSLSGEVRPVRGALPAALKCAQARRRLIVPRDNAREAVLASGAAIYCTRHLGELSAALHAGALDSLAVSSTEVVDCVATTQPDLADVRGQHQARRALEIAAAGGHSLLMVGPPGAGKSMLAARLPGLMPPLDETEAVEVAAIASVGNAGFDPRHWRRRPFRAPHHTASAVALVGGGPVPRPGEVTLAHRGVLFLDEICEFDRAVLEVLREPLETGWITISRALRKEDFPARFQLVAAMNPCPCGYLGDPGGRCRCTPDQVGRYRARLSGPMLDRIDLQLFVPRVQRDVLLRRSTRDAGVETSACVRARVAEAAQRQDARAGKPNAQLTGREIERDCGIDEPTHRLLDAAMTRLGLSARAFHRVLKVARTIADLAGAQDLSSAHVAEALRLRALDSQTH
ncbi:MAG: ATP-dependent protease [Panacagrimonas sp.]|jgi:magnesium chelatase family protein|nr:YifB family Mg chelatase-like AAA ATPase [Panacagrimonas sp.]MCC2657149.1 ATP-dependent protease [Panacagrimonas sp.]